MAGALPPSSNRQGLHGMRHLHHSDLLDILTAKRANHFADLCRPGKVHHLNMSQVKRSLIETHPHVLMADALLDPLWSVIRGKVNDLQNVGWKTCFHEEWSQCRVQAWN